MYKCNFIRCGVIGLFLEILYTALKMLQRRNFLLQGTTSLWMFPIYGCACFLHPVFHVFKHFPVAVRGSFYALLIYSMEYVSGRILDKHHLLPWDYSASSMRINKYVRLDFFPYWFFAGLLYERITKAA